MTCELARTNIVAYLKGEHSEGRKKRLEEHLAICPSCRKELSAARNLLSWTEAASEPSVEKRVADIIEGAVKAKASDIHIDPRNDNTLRIRYRIDGVIHDVGVVETAMRSGVVARFKMLGDMAVSETKAPQDGRFFWKQDSMDIDVRVSVCPYALGEGIVMRLLDRNMQLPALQELYLSPDHLKTIKGLIHQPNGMFFTSGPTGSGKTTSLYSIMLELNDLGVRVVSVEDPVEYLIEGINQSQVYHRGPHGYLYTLRALMRQDPDVIMVGEIQDKETAGQIVSAAMTGHMILSQLHTNGAVDVIQRLRDIEVDDFMISATLLGALNQRLPRRLCLECRRRVTTGSGATRFLSISENDIISHEVYHAAGCDKCRGTGYRGRIAIYELLAVDRHLSEMIGSGVSTAELLEAAKLSGFKPIVDDARRKVLEGLTTAEECVRVLSISE